VPLPLIDVGNWDPSTFHCLQWELEEPNINQGCQDIEVANVATPPTIHHWMVDPGMIHMFHPTVSPILWNQAIQV
jgi:hypothetical protein